VRFGVTDNADMAAALIFDTPETVTQWRAIDDQVMGGMSASRMRFDPASFAVFEGVVSLENNGGFASVRAACTDLASAHISGYQLTVRGDGKRYKLNLRTDDAFDGVNYQAVFVPPAGVWVTLTLHVADFQPTWRGRPVPEAGPLHPARVCQLGWMVADRQAGPFALAIASIVCLQEPAGAR